MAETYAVTVSSTLDSYDQQVKGLYPAFATAQDALDKILHAAEAVKDETVQVLARKAKSSLTETKRLVGAALEESGRLQEIGRRSVGEITEELSPEQKTAGVNRLITQEAGAKFAQLFNQIVNRVLNEDLGGNFFKLISVSVLTNSTSVLKELAKAVTATGVSMSGLDALSGTEFEGLITRLLEHMGFRAGMTKASGDGGIDIVATLDRPLIGGRYLIQCKRYAPDSLVGAATVREFCGALTADRPAVKGILIATSGFTAQAMEFSRGLPIELIAREQLKQLLEQHGLLHAEITDLHPYAQLFTAYGSILEFFFHWFPSKRVDFGDWDSFRGNVMKIIARLGSCDVLGPYPGSSVGAAPQPKDRAAELLDLALKMREEGKDAEAIKLLREATQLRPDNPDVSFWLGMCYNAVGLHDEQIAALREAVRLKPDFGDAWYWLGMGLHAVGNLDAAADALTKALTVQPDDAYALTQWGRICRDKGDKKGALLAFQKAVKIKPDDVSAWFQLGLTHEELGGNPEALSAYREALRIDPNHALSWERLCSVYRNLGDRARMLQALSRLEQLNPAKARELRRGLL
jgi:tetratricopeptide (TPR) repeat protein